MKARDYLPFLEKMKETYCEDANKDDLPEYADYIGDDPDTFDPAFDNVNKKIQRM